MIILPTGAFTVLQDEAQEVPPQKIIINLEEVHNPKKPNTGIITYTAPELNKYQGCRVVFRENFSENIKIGETPLLYFRDFESSIYYVIEDKK